MRTLAQKLKPTQQTRTTKEAISGRANCRYSHDVNSILHLQRAIGNRAVQRLLQSNAEEFHTEPAAPASTRFGHDFNRMSIFNPSPGQVQPKVTVSAPGDMYEQEADRVAEQVMRMPEPRIQRACSCGGGCPKCQSRQLGWGHEGLQMKHIQAGGKGQIAAPAIVQEALHSPGQPLNYATREFMEPRFGRGFGQVRVHADAKAAESARALHALAYTLGRDVVFGAGRYAPGTAEGDRLLAHELAHVVQQQAAGPARQQSASARGILYKASASAAGIIQRDGPSASPVTRPTLSDLRTIALGSINGRYYSAASNALSDFESAMTHDFDWVSFFVTLAGNLTWAAACFAEGPEAFLISVAGITAATPPPPVQRVSSNSDFHRDTMFRINQQIIQPALNRVDTVTRDVDALAATNNWDDNQTRRALLERLVKPEYIETLRGGIPAVNRAAIRQNMTNELITKANAYRPNVHGVQDIGEFVYYYTVSNYINHGGFFERGQLYAADHLKPPSDWRFTLDRVALRLPQGGGNATRALTGTLHPASMPFSKRLSITGAESSWDELAVTTTAQNRVDFIGESIGIFDQIWPANPMKLGTHFSLGGSALDTGRAIVHKAWAANGGLPPDVTNPQPFHSY